jgi:hypothetical protein
MDPRFDRKPSDEIAESTDFHQLDPRNQKEGDTMNFIETLKNLGGVKPCPTTEWVGEGDIKTARVCRICHGTGTVLDLAPLLAKPDKLRDCVNEFLLKIKEKAECPKCGGLKKEMTIDGPLPCMQCNGAGYLYVYPVTPYVIGPQRAGNLVYEVARQLGGTAVVAEEVIEVQSISADAGCEPPEDNEVVVYNDTFAGDHCFRQLTKYRLSLPIPDNAMVLFVTDRVDNQEMLSCTRTLYEGDGAPEFGWARKILPYVLALVSTEDTVDSKWKVISMHKESK